MADITRSRGVRATRPRGGMIALALVVIAAARRRGPRSTSARSDRVPAPFGPAANGLIPYASNGDIYLGDPVTGQTPSRSSQSPETNSGRELRRPTARGSRSPATSRRTTLTDVYVVGIDGTDLRRITLEPLDT